MLHSSPRDKKRHIHYVGLSKFWGVFSYPVELWSCSPKARNYSRQDAKGHLAGRSYNSPRDKKRHIQYVGLSKFWGVFSYPVELWSCSPKARNYSRQDAKGHLAGRSYNSPRDKKRHIQYVGLSKFWGVFSYPVELWATRGKMPKGILLIARTVPIPIPTLLFI